EQCIGLLEFGGGYSGTDLESYFEGIGQPVPEVVSVGVDGASNAPTGDPNGPDAEVELDIELAGALAPAARIAVYFAPNSEQGFVDALTTAVHDSANSPSVISISWGSPENSWSASGRSAFEAATQDAALQGVTVLAASGDEGAADGGPSGTLAVDFPASSPFAIGCGGTRLTVSGGNIVSETVWNDLSEGEGATGGGVSEDFAKPTYQSGVTVPAAPNGYDGRGVPDVSANADPDTGYAVFVDGAPAVIGGTSAVAPLWAALVARLGQGLGKPLGFANPLLYGPAEAATFREITSGNNDGYTAGPGWNPCTGLGSPQGSRLLAALKG
ncbi:MAG TPA: S53 family peptidase, partial [Thermoplasmata archaeon]|nr:S53 family peptidase [Thermoplasmata archaeon]